MRKQSIFLMIISVVLLLSLVGCDAAFEAVQQSLLSNLPSGSPPKKLQHMQDVAQDIIDCFIAQDEQALYALLNRAGQAYHGNEFYSTKDQIKEAFDFIDGEIISYELPTSTGSGEAAYGGGRTTYEDMSPIIKEVATDTGKVYQIHFYYIFICEDNPSEEGLRSISVQMIEGLHGFSDNMRIGGSSDGNPGNVIPADAEPKKYHYISEVLHCIRNKDVEALKSKFCPIISNMSGIDEQIQELFDFIDGDIISFSADRTNSRSGYDRTWYSYFTRVREVKTNTGKTYQLRFFHELKNDGYDDRLGISELRLRNQDGEEFIVGDFDTVKPDWPYHRAGYYTDKSPYSITKQ
ncbi:MAG: DUF5104 domain-containing protein [Oscillospiraceae bacterium]|nr:DUF5104 domain-containing protein [Oscillospiraceae bacterium]